MAFIQVLYSPNLPPLINQSFYKSNVSVTSVEYGTKRDLYQRDITGFFLTLNTTVSPIDSVDQLNTEGIFAMDDIFDIDSTS